MPPANSELQSLSGKEIVEAIFARSTFGLFAIRTDEGGVFVAQGGSQPGGLDGSALQAAMNRLQRSIEAPFGPGSVCGPLRVWQGDELSERQPSSLLSELQHRYSPWVLMIQVSGQWRFAWSGDLVTCLGLLSSIWLKSCAS